MFSRSVFCITHSRGCADRILHELKGAELPGGQISVLFLDHNAGDGAATTGRPVAESAGEIRGVMEWIPGIRSLVIPGCGPLIAAGPLPAEWGGATTGGVGNALVAFGVPSAEAGRYAERITGGHILIAFHTDNPEKCHQAREIFTAAGAEDVFTMVQVSTPKPPPRLLSATSFRR